MMLYLLAIRTVALSMTHLFSSRHLAAAFAGLCITSMALVSGYAVHHQDVGQWALWLKYVSPQWWMSHPIVQDELYNDEITFQCTGNPQVEQAIQQRPIIKKMDCGLSKAKDVVWYFDYLSKDFLKSTDHRWFWEKSNVMPILITVLFYIFFQLLDVVFFLFRRQVSRQSRAKKNKM